MVSVTEMSRRELLWHLDNPIEGGFGGDCTPEVWLERLRIELVARELEGR